MPGIREPRIGGRSMIGRCPEQSGGEHGSGKKHGVFQIQMGVEVGGGAVVAVAQPGLNLLHGYAIAQQKARTAVPLRYNKDKRKNPVFSRVSAFVVAYSIPFPTLIRKDLRSTETKRRTSPRMTKRRTKNKEKARHSLQKL